MVTSADDGSVFDLVSRTGPPLRLQWEADSGGVRVCDPPVPVEVQMRSVDPEAGQPDYGTKANHPSLRVRASGIRFEAVENGWLLAWVRLADGQFRAIVAVELRSANNRTALHIQLYVRPEAVRKSERGRFQMVSAPPFPLRVSASFSAGVRQPRVSRGRPLSSAATASR